MIKYSSEQGVNSYFSEQVYLAFIKCQNTQLENRIKDIRKRIAEITTDWHYML